MKNLIIAIAILMISMPAVYAQKYDSQSVNSRYDQYSPNNINSPYNQYEDRYSPTNINNPYNQYDNQYSPNNINNPYSQYGIQYSSKSVSTPFVQEEHDWHAAGIVSEATKGKEPKKVKKSPEADLASSFLDNTKPKKNIPVFFYLLVLSSLAVGATMFIIIGLFKK